MSGTRGERRGYNGVQESNDGYECQCVRRDEANTQSSLQGKLARSSAPRPTPPAPLPVAAGAARTSARLRPTAACVLRSSVTVCCTSTTLSQGLTLVHCSAQLERFYEIGGARMGCVAHAKGVLGGV
jgi:hypothetical protein